MLRKKYLLIWGAVLLVSCVTVNVYFPAAAVQRAADEIVNDVRKGPVPDQVPPATPGQMPGPKSDKSSLPLLFRFVRVGASEAQAGAAMDLNVSTPAIRALKTSMASRFPQLQPFCAKGTIGETSTGLVALRDAAALSLQEKAQVTRLVEQENADRQALYAEIIKANNLDSGRMSELQRLFANSWREKSSPGWWIQQDNGTWVKK